MIDTEYAPAVPGGRPEMPVEHAELYDTWLIPNGIVGLLPLDATITVVAGRMVIFPEWRHLDPTSSPWDNDVMVASDLWGAGIGGDPDDGDKPLVNERTELLKVPVTDRVRELFSRTSLTLVER